MRLKEFRGAKGMTQEQVAKHLGIPTKTYQNYEREVREADSVILCKLADLFEATLDELVGRDVPLQDCREMELIRLFSKLNDTGRSKLIDYADDLVSSGKYGEKEMCDSQVSGYKEVLSA